MILIAEHGRILPPASLMAATALWLFAGLAALSNAYMRCPRCGLPKWATRDAGTSRRKTTPA